MMLRLRLENPPVKKSSFTPSKAPPSGHRPYWYVNMAAAIVHGLHVVVIFMIYGLVKNSDGDAMLDVCYSTNASYVSWDDTTDPPTVTTQYTAAATLSLTYLTAAFHLLSCVFELAPVLYRKGEAYEAMVARGTNHMRFVEYAFSASVMLVCIALLTGVRDSNVLLGIVALCAATQMIGMVVEELHVVGAQLWSIHVLHVLAWGTMVSSYGLVARHFFTALSQNTATPPTYVYVIIVSIFVLYMSFGVVQVVQLYRPCGMTLTCGLRTCGGRPCVGTDAAEMWYVMLSLVSKTLLGWLVYANVLAGPMAVPSTCDPFF